MKSVFILQDEQLDWYIYDTATGAAVFHLTNGGKDGAMCHASSC